MTAALTLDDPRYFDRLAEAEERHWWSESMWRLASTWIGAAIAGREGLCALDVGCGAGGTLKRLSRLPEVARVVGLEPSADALGRSRRRIGAPLLRGSALGLPFADGSFDLVVCCDVLQHLEPGEDGIAAGEIARVLRPGGFALIRSNAAPRRGPIGGGRAYRLGDLVGLLESSGLMVRRATHVNAIGWLARQAKRLATAGAAGAHPSGRGLRLVPPSRPVNALMGAAMRLENWATGRLGLALALGDSTMLLAERPSGRRSGDADRH